VILTNGVIYTMDPAVPRLRALPVTRDGRVARGVEAWEGDSSAVSNERIDLAGRVVLPGFCDTHVHFRSWAVEALRVDLSGCASARAAAALVGATPPTTQGWTLGQGFREASLPDAAEIDARLLDDACHGRPVALWAHDRHTLWLSSAALAAVGIGSDTTPPPGGVIERRRDGSPRGILREQAAWRVALPDATEREAFEAVRVAQRRAHAHGVTAIHDMQRDGFGIWQMLAAQRSLTLRVVACVPVERFDAARTVELRGGFGDERLAVGPVKAFMDGTLGSRTARMLASYSDGGDGVEITSVEALGDVVLAAARGGLAVAVHAIGDRGVRDALDVFAQTRSVWQEAGLRSRIEHAQLVDPADIARFGQIGVVASMQPAMIASDRQTADQAWGARCAYAFALRSLLDAGTTVALSSDAPIEPLRPFDAVHAAVNRTLDDRPAWYPQQAVTVTEAIAGFTTSAALAAGTETRTGRLTPGFPADLVVVDRDPFTCPASELRGVEVVATMIGGRWVHGRPPW
jgi:predicted amidohydrolase YtcJ